MAKCLVRKLDLKFWKVGLRSTFYFLHVQMLFSVTRLYASLLFAIPPLLFTPIIIFMTSSWQLSMSAIEKRRSLLTTYCSIFRHCHKWFNEISQYNTETNRKIWLLFVYGFYLYLSHRCADQTSVAICVISWRIPLTGFHNCMHDITLFTNSR